jgi:parallel beta-helix repeat protein
LKRIKAALVLVILGMFVISVGFSSFPATAGHRGNIVFVDDDGYNSPCGSARRPCKTIQLGVNHASPGEVVKVQKGTYSGVTINKRVDVKGISAASTSIAGCVVITANQAKFSDFTVRNCPKSGVYVTADNVTVKFNTIRNNGWNGVRLNDSSNCLISSNEIRTNGRDGIQLDGGSNRNLIILNKIRDNEQNGIDAQGSDFNWISKNSEIKDNERDGIRISNSNWTTIRENQVKHNGYIPFTNPRHGIFLHNAAHTSIINNKVSDNALMGIYVTNRSIHTRIEDNDVFDNRDDGIILEEDLSANGGTRGDDLPEFPSFTDIIDNRVYNNHHEGIHVYSGSFTTIESCRVYSNRLAGIALEPDAGEGNTIVSSRVYDNGKAGMPLAFNRVPGTASTYSGILIPLVRLSPTRSGTT